MKITRNTPPVEFKPITIVIEDQSELLSLLRDLQRLDRNNTYGITDDLIEGLKNENIS